MKVLLLLAHADDESLGAGGTIQQLLAQGHQVQLIIASDGVVDMRDQATDNRAPLARACGILGIPNWATLGLPDQRFEQIAVSEIARKTAKAIHRPPDLIITHSHRDLNQDHRIISEVAKIIGRPRNRAVSILTCEIPCVGLWNGEPFQPNFYVPLSEDQLKRKIEAFGCYSEENKTFPDPYSAEGLKTLARQRGMESGSDAAEAFEIIRWYPQHGWKMS